MMNANENKRLLMLGDITGTPGRLAVMKYLPTIIEKYKIDFVVANAENVDSSRRGISISDANDLYASGVDVITLGNHAFANGEVYTFINDKKIIRPANMIGVPGQGYTIITKDDVKYCIISVMGNYDMPFATDNVFNSIKKILGKINSLEGKKCIVIDCHAQDATEKYSIAFHFSITALFGTHTHIPTGDLIILPNGTAYQTDVGMCGDYSFIYGKNPSSILNKMIYWKSIKNFSNKNTHTVCSTMLVFNPNNSKAIDLEQIIYSNFLLNRTNK